MASPLLNARSLVRVGDEESLQDACTPSTDTSWALDWFMYGTAFDGLDGVIESTIPSSLSPTYALPGKTVVEVLCCGYPLGRGVHRWDKRSSHMQLGRGGAFVNVAGILIEDVPTGVEFR
jgi:hypothetical protein